MKPDRVAAYLSLCLPGLGQLYQRRLVATGLFFLAFCALASLTKVRPYLPLWAAVAGLEALRHPPAIDDKKRLRVFTAFGAICFFLWASMVVVTWLPWTPALESVNSKLQ